MRRPRDEQLRHANAVWTAPEYADLTLRGEVANAIKPWPGLLGESARAEVRDSATLPYLVAEQNSLLSRVLTDVWDRDDVSAFLLGTGRPLDRGRATSARAGARMQPGRVLARNQEPRSPTSHESSGALSKTSAR